MLSIMEIIDDIKNYFIDDKIKINDMDKNIGYLELLKLYILKFYRLIGLILICVLLITMYCDDTMLEKTHVMPHAISHIIIQKGGADLAPTPSAPSAPATPDLGAGAGDAPGAAAAPAPKKGMFSKLKSKISAKADKITGKLAAKGGVADIKGVGDAAAKVGTSIGDKAGALGNKAMSGKTYKKLGSKAFKLGAGAANKFKEVSPIFYQVLYTIAFTLIISILVLPSFCFFIIGIICYFLLKSKIKGLKGL